MNRTTPAGDSDIAHAARLFADPTRARVLAALADGRMLPAGELAAEAGVSAQAVSAQLSRLSAAGLLAVERSGRHRYYRLASPQVAVVLEALAALAPAQPVRSLRQVNRGAALRTARTCYDHLAGRLGVALTRALVEHGALTAVDTEPGDAAGTAAGAGTGTKPVPAPYALGPAAPEVFAALGVAPERLSCRGSERRPLLHFCVDWSERRHHLAGRLGADLLSAMTEAGWLLRRPRQRAVQLSDLGAAQLRSRLAFTDTAEYCARPPV
ncbi:DNA-binding transcriptional ArsR family regulator [Kitasatospora sp. MAP12-15]|uniref:ArsR/SmtB family transcription factor n=1 Tax=unclassified Kitasatospora TaxID=2633591 RepID=UPI0024766F55|nr:metalloregulator ArsR/SmtB family transcription factor [Kitasatospora sp. MAP12-44]MDH6108787.1 DNA-binding transcriptional ArsR family regulator [Kitasatospora sp. MAP12-44]